MIALDNGDKIRGDAAAANEIDYLIFGFVGTVATQIADGQLPAAIGDLYAAGADGIGISSIILVNTGTVTRAVNLYLTPSGGSARRLIPKDYSLAAGEAIYTDGTVLKPEPIPLAQEAWHLIGAGGEPAFENSWVNYGGVYETAAYYKDDFGIVHLKGLVKDGSVIGTTVFTLPAGYRPSLAQHFAVPSNNAYGHCQVYADGKVTAMIGSTTWFSLNGITFRVA